MSEWHPTPTEDRREVMEGEGKKRKKERNSCLST
jgi:hypothetical protein